jgi:serine/threonine-protein kinase RsbW
MKSKQDVITIEKILTSDKKVLSEIENIIASVQQFIPFEKDKFHNMLVATTEAVINAIQHGNQNDPSKYVTLKIIAYDKKVNIFVIDQGKGFDVSKIEDPRTPENIFKERGRGIFIIRELSDSVKITSSSKGTTVLMQFRL